MSESSRAYRYLPLLTLALAVVSLACFVVPMYVLWPFRHQGATELGVALRVKQVGPWVSAGCVALVLVFGIAAWPRARWAAKSALAIALLLAGGGAYLARLNVYEALMFHPLGAPHFVSAQEARLDKDDMLLTVRVNGEARAYPIREIAYHHVVNDTVAGEPIVATY